MLNLEKRLMTHYSIFQLLTIFEYTKFYNMNILQDETFHKTIHLAKYLNSI